ncbi:MAG: PIG-L family deacetylase [Hymenobacter sp.]
MPHPDDEALGCGGLLALLRRAGQPVYVALVSDGTMPAPQLGRASAPARRAVREGELRHALALLDVHTEPLLLRLPDAAVPTAPEQPGFAEAADRLRAFMVDNQIATVLLALAARPAPRPPRQLPAGSRRRWPGCPPRRASSKYVVGLAQRAAPADLPQPGRPRGGISPEYCRSAAPVVGRHCRPSLAGGPWRVHRRCPGLFAGR